uniref:Uncharacterized protein n=1 Tax=Globisporangium ultimum (strain ATCC 200006 / CBS 805.95 / DAOM BR144) TaxID=431595 RepID=K3WHL2_GLOUD
MSDKEREQLGDADEDGEDDSYANAYLNDNDDDDDDDDDLAEMFAKVKTIQQAEGIQPNSEQRKPNQDESKPTDTTPTLDVKLIQAPRTSTARGDARSNGSTPTSGRKISRSPSSAGCGARATISGDGIKTISRRTLGSAGTSSAGGVRIDALLNVKKPAIYEDKLLQTAKSSDMLEKLKMKTVMAAPEATINKRIEGLSAPAKKQTERKFATDDEERHCRFWARKSSAKKAAASNYDDDGASSGKSDFIARMEAAEKSKQKKLEMTRGENEYNARLDKKCCPKCTMPQSYSEFKEKKKRCQMCGVEFRILQAWGDVGSEFISRMHEASQVKAEKQQQIRAQVIQHETSAMEIKKTAKQQFYEKQMVQKNNQRTFLERNYQSNSTSKTKQTQIEIEIQPQAQRARLIASNGGDSPVI